MISTGAHRRCFMTTSRSLPPALVLTAGFDPLRDEGREYADRLVAAGNRATYVCFERQIHGFITMGKVIDEANAAVTLCAARARARPRRAELCSAGRRRLGRRLRLLRALLDGVPGLAPGFGRRMADFATGLGSRVSHLAARFGGRVTDLATGLGGGVADLAPGFRDGVPALAAGLGDGVTVSRPASATAWPVLVAACDALWPSRLNSQGGDEPARPAQRRPASDDSACRSPKDESVIWRNARAVKQLTASRRGPAKADNRGLAPGRRCGRLESP